MRPIRVWQSAAVCGFALLCGMGSRPLRSEDHPQREHSSHVEHEHARDHKREHGEHDRPLHQQDDHDHRDHSQGDHQGGDHDRPVRDRAVRDHSPKDHDQLSPHHHDGDHHVDGHHAVKDATQGELHDVARSLRSIVQSYGFRGFCGCGSYTAGSAFRDWHARGEQPPHGQRRVLPPPPLVLGGCRDCGRDPADCTLERRICTGCGHVYPIGQRSGCGCGGGYNLRPAPPMPNDHERDDCYGESRYSEHHFRDCHHPSDGHHHDHEARPYAGQECPLLDRRICTGCGHVYPRNEQPRCGCHSGHLNGVPQATPSSNPTPVDHLPLPPTMQPVPEDKGEPHSDSR